MTQYKAKSTLIHKGVRYQQGQTFLEKEISGVSDELVAEYFIEIVSKKELSKTQTNAEINDDSDEETPTEDTLEDTEEAPQSPAPQVQGKGGKGKGKGKGGK